MTLAIVHAVYLLRAHADHAAAWLLWQAVQHAHAHRDLVARAWHAAAADRTDVAMRACQQYLTMVGYGL